VALEASGVYWKPAWQVLEGHFELILAHAAHVKNVPGRKTDANDAEGLSDLAAHGLIAASFVPPEPVQDLRDLTRTRKQIAREVVQHTSRIQKVLESANVKLTGLITDILGVGGRAILDAIVAGESDPEKLSKLAPRVRATPKQLAEALRGRVREHHRFSSTLAWTIVPEIGTDMSRFKTPQHLTSWACLCPRNDESAGKRRSTKIRSRWLKEGLIQAAWSVARMKRGYLAGRFHRIRARRGPKKAAVAVASSLLTIAYCMLRDGTTFQDLGGHHCDPRDKQKAAKRLLPSLEQLGIKLELRAAL